MLNEHGLFKTYHREREHRAPINSSAAALRRAEIEQQTAEFLRRGGQVSEIKNTLTGYTGGLVTATAPHKNETVKMVHKTPKKPRTRRAQK